MKDLFALKTRPAAARGRKTWLFVRFIFALVFFAVSLLAIWPAPTLAIFRWRVAIVEYGHWLGFAPLLLLFMPSGNRAFLGMLGSLFAVLSAGLCFSAALRASRFAPEAAAQIDRAFGPALTKFSTTNPGAFSWKSLWSIRRSPDIPARVLTYAQADGRPLHALFFSAENSTPAPCVIIVHGGGWESGTADEFPGITQFFAQSGYAVAAIEYRLAPRWSWPAPREDVLALIRFLRAHAAEFHLDPERFILLGRSAGGQIAEAVAYSAHDPAICGCIALYAPSDMFFSYEFSAEDDILRSPALLRQYLGGDPKRAAANFTQASGLLLADAKSPPTLLIHGGTDELVWVRQSERLAARLSELGVAHAYLRFPWATHALDYNVHSPSGQIATFAIRRFLEKFAPLLPAK